MSKIHPTAIVDSSASIHESVEIGPYSVIGPEVSIAADCELKSHVIINTQFFWIIFLMVHRISQLRS